MAVAESASQADTRSVAVFVQQYDNISTDTERRAGLSAIAEPLIRYSRQLLPGVLLC